MALPTYYFYDETLYREDEKLTLEAFIDGTWHRVVPSQQDLDHLREIGEAEARELKPQAV